MKQTLLYSLRILGASYVALSIAGAHAADKASAKGRGRSIASEMRAVRLNQAKEILGKHYKKSVVRVGERVRNVNPFVHEWTKNNLKGEWAKKSRKVSQAIIDEAYARDFDPVFLLAVIQNESRFNPLARGSVGEIGLMQIKPDTAEWISKKFKLTWKGEKSLEDPVTNIRIGAAFLSYLRERFDSHARLYLSAYNMGARNVDELLDEKVWPKEYSNKVMGFYLNFYGELKSKMRANAKAAPKSPTRTLASTR